MARATRIGLASCLVIVAALVVAGTVESGPAAAVGGLLVLAAIVLVIPAQELRELLQNLKSLKAGPEGIAAEWHQRAKSVASVDAPEEQERDTGKSKSVSDLRMLLEAKLAYIAKSLLEDRPTFVTIGSLHYDGYLDDETAEVADELMTLREEDLQDLSAGDRQDALATGDEVVRTIRARTLQGWVRKILDDAEGWDWRPVDRGPDKVPDYLATSDERRLLIAAVFATSPNSKIFTTARNRLIKGADAPAGVTRRVIVLPRRAKQSMVDEEGDPAVVRAQDLSKLLASGGG